MQADDADLSLDSEEEALFFDAQQDEENLKQIQKKMTINED